MNKEPRDKLIKFTPNGIPYYPVGVVLSYNSSGKEDYVVIGYHTSSATTTELNELTKYPMDRHDTIHLTNTAGICPSSSPGINRWQTTVVNCYPGQGGHTAKYNVDGILRALLKGSDT
jgi:hypothetical protein